MAFEKGQMNDKKKRGASGSADASARFRTDAETADTFLSSVGDEAQSGNSGTRETIIDRGTDERGWMKNFENIRDLRLFGDESEDPGNRDKNYARRYTLKGLVGEGGLGRVLLGFDRRIEREVAIKEMLVTDARAVEERVLLRFVREAKITGQLDHPGVVPVYEMGVKPEGGLYYVMRYIRGETLSRAISKSRGESPEAALKKRLHYLGNLIDVCETMAYAHSKGIIHRDLKPDNIVIGSFGETVILDWGLARTGDMEDDSLIRKIDPKRFEGSERLTLDDEILGTPAFMSPEQVKTEFGPIDARSDVYALGAILYMILTGETVYSGSAGMILSVLASEHSSPSPRARGVAIPPELAAICEKAMNKRRAERFADAGEMAEQLKAYRDGRLVSVHAYTPGELFRRFIARNRLAIGAAAAVVLAIVVGAGFALNFAIDAHVARQRAENALVEISDLSNATFQLSRIAADRLERGLERTTAAMEKSALELAGIDPADANKVDRVLTRLHKEFPWMESFMLVVAPGRIAAAYPDKYDGVIGADISGQEHIKYIFSEKKKIFSRVFLAVEGFHAVTLQIPVLRGDEIVASVAAVMRPEKVVPLAFPDLIEKNRTAKIWCMQKDGYILYDDNEHEVGRMLFQDELYAKFPELKKFASRMLSDPSGIGHYSFFDADGEQVVHKVAAWHTLVPSCQTEWKIVVVEPYRQK